MLGVTAYDVAARMKYQRSDLEEPPRRTLEHLTEIGGEGGFIAVDADGNIVMPFNSEGMYRGNMVDGKMTIEIISRLAFFVLGGLELPLFLARAKLLFSILIAIFLNILDVIRHEVGKRNHKFAFTPVLDRVMDRVAAVRDYPDCGSVPL